MEEVRGEYLSFLFKSGKVFFSNVRVYLRIEIVNIKYITIIN